ncbi:MAG: single-stranded-DNA-specific exonuclease RecJ [Acidaminococcaceae bacterium]|nr:single-stranded-DNA-specific exonuclease RecJ [Acidaminococcaceae bacterium]
MLKKKILHYNEENKPIADKLVAELKISPLVLGVLANRGMQDPEDIKTFLYGASQPFHDPFLLKDMDRAVERILLALHNKEKITVYGDYDVDGMTASSLLYLFLKKQGALVDVYIPRREDEGYGLNSEALQNLFEQGTTLLITVDSGISGSKEVADAPAGMDIVITDHHTPPPVLPEAYAIINPHQQGCAYPFKQLAGVGVAFKLCQALFKKITGSNELWRGHLEFVAMGTVADIVPLVGENRELVRMGLKSFRKTSSKGLRELIRVAQIAPTKQITSETIGFILAPRLNAVGRLEHALSAVHLLTTEEDKQAKEIAEFLNQENITRQAISKKIFEEAEALLQQQDTIDTAIVLYKEEWHAGVIGIVASRLVDKYHLPAILLTKDGDKVKGSCRSIPPLNLYEALAGSQECLLQFGGHKQAAGLTLQLEQVERFKQVFRQQVQLRLKPEDYLPTIVPDYFVPQGKSLTVQAVKGLDMLGPFGAENPAPIFAFASAKLTSFRTVGKDNHHLKFYLKQGDTAYRAVAWNEGERLNSYYVGEEAALAFAPKVNDFNGLESVDLQLLALETKHNIVDARLHYDNKLQQLKSILQNGEKTVIYLHDINVKPAINVKANLLYAVYGETKLASDVRQVVFYDVPPSQILTKQGFPLRDRQDIALYLLYNRTDEDKIKQYIFRKYPTKAGMVLAYKYLIALLKEYGPVTMKELLDKPLAKEQYLGEAVLKVFAQLGFVALADGIVTYKGNSKTDLHKSSLYCHMEGQRNNNLNELELVMRKISAVMLREVWQ